MPNIGDTLREARMREHLDIADVESRTKIRAKYLRALENEEFGMLPGPTFVKTFLRTYAEALGLDPQVLVEEYRATYESREEVEHLQPLGPTAVSPGAPARRGPAARALARDRPRGRRGGRRPARIGLVGGDDDGGGGSGTKPADHETQPSHEDGAAEAPRRRSA